MKTIQDTIENYIQGTKTGDVKTLESVFEKNAVMSGDLGDKKLVLQSPEIFFDDINGKMVNAEYTYSIESIHAYGEIATATIKECNLNNTDFINIFQLQMISGEWQIISKLFTTI